MNEAALIGALRLLELAPGASADDVAAAVKRLVRRWRKRTDAPRLEARQEAERMLEALASAERDLLGPEGRAYLQRATGARPCAPSVSSEAVDPAGVATIMDAVLGAVGTRARARRRTVVERSVRLFHEGVDYIVEETVHKSYERHKDRRRYRVLAGGSVLFEHSVGGPTGQTVTGTYLAGAWLGQLAALRATLPPDAGA